MQHQAACARHASVMHDTSMHRACHTGDIHVFHSKTVDAICGQHFRIMLAKLCQVPVCLGMFGYMLVGVRLVDRVRAFDHCNVPCVNCLCCFRMYHTYKVARNTCITY